MDDYLLFMCENYYPEGGWDVVDKDKGVIVRKGEFK